MVVHFMNHPNPLFHTYKTWSLTLFRLGGEGGGLLMPAPTLNSSHFEGHVLLKFEFLAYFCRFSWIMMLGIEYFGNLEHYCFEKYDIWEFFSQTVTSSMMSYKFKGKLIWLMTL